jgi:hypothetical protein
MSWRQKKDFSLLIHLYNMFVHKTPTNPSCGTVKNLLFLKNSFNIDRFLIFVWLGRGTQHNDTWHNNKKTHNDIQHNDIKYCNAECHLF